METLNLLKQEINQAIESEHDFAKWKLIVVAGLGGTALGLGKEGDPHYWLLLFIPFACAYVDLHLYQTQERILVLAQFIRDYRPVSADEKGDTILQDYEANCAELRRQHNIFDLGQHANFAASIGLSLAAGLAVAAYPRSTEKTSIGVWVAGIIWGVGIVLILSLKLYHSYRLKLIERFQEARNVEKQGAAEV